MKPIAITQGDAAGIGPEIIARAVLQDPQAMAGCIVVGDLAVMRRAAALFAGSAGLSLPVAQVRDWQDARHVPPGCLAVRAQGVPPGAPPWGRPSAEAGRQAAACIRIGAQAALGAEVAALVTAPIHKRALAQAGEDWPGHTELLQGMAAAHAGVPVQAMPVRMMVANAHLRVVLVSIHVPLREALDRVQRDAVLQTVRIAHHSLKSMLGLPPRLAVAGLNPHAGEDGRFGDEERTEIAPAIEAARAEGIDASGPWPPDTVFMQARAGAFDAVVAMYHDQGLIPVKYLGLEHGVNTTLGLPFVRTSPDHGTAFDMAGQGRASADSLLAAVRQARALAGLAQRDPSPGVSPA